MRSQLVVSVPDARLDAWRDSTDRLFEWWRSVDVLPGPDLYGVAPGFRASVLLESLADPAALEPPHGDRRARRTWAQAEAWFAQLPHSHWVRDGGPAVAPLSAALPGWLAADVVEALVGLAGIVDTPVELRPWLRALPAAEGDDAWERERKLLRAQVAPPWPGMSRPIPAPDETGRELPVPPLVLDAAHLNVLRHGLDRVDMDIKWMWRLEGEVLRVWRSWTDRLVFEAHLHPHGKRTRHCGRLLVYGQVPWPPLAAATMFCGVVLKGVQFAVAGAPVGRPQISPGGT